MPKPFPKEFRDDVVAIALKRESSFAQIAKDFGISESLRITSRTRPGVPNDDSSPRANLTPLGGPA